MSRPSLPLGLVLLFSLLLFAATPCFAGDKKNDNKVVFSGFLEDYSKLQPAEEVDLAFGYTKKPGILREYKRLHIPRVIFYFHASAEPVRVDADRLKELADYFHEELTEELGKVREIVDEPGPGVAVLRVAITELASVKQGGNIGLKAAGAATGVGLLVPAVDVGGASMEAEVVDGESGERLVAVVDREMGRRMMNFNALSKTGDARKAFRSWAKDFRKKLKRIDDGKKP